MGESEDREATLAIVLETKLIQTKIVLQMLFIGIFIFLQKIPYGECSDMLNYYATLHTYVCIFVVMEFIRFSMRRLFLCVYIKIATVLFISSFFKLRLYLLILSKCWTNFPLYYFLRQCYQCKQACLILKVDFARIQCNYEILTLFSIKFWKR